MTQYFADRDAATGELVLRTTNRERFLSIVGGFGIPDIGAQDTSGQFALSVVGLATDHTAQILEEHAGSLPDVEARALSATHRLLLDAIYLDVSERPEAVRALDAVDGLTRHRTEGKNVRGDTLWKTPAEHIPDFRSRETTTSLKAVRPDYAMDALAQYSTVGRMIRTGRVAQGRHCTWWAHLEGMPSEVRLRHPWLQAVAFGVHGCELQRERVRAERPESRDATPHGWNLQR